MPRIRSAIDLTELLAPSTLCKAFDRLDMAVWRVLPNLSVSLRPTNGVAGIDASGFDRSHASKHYTKRAKLMIQQIRAIARKNGIRPLIKHREFPLLQNAWNARLDTERYAQRSQSETVNFRLERKYGAFVRSRRWWKQFRELALVCIVHNLDRAI